MLIALAQGAREYARLQHRRLPSTERLISGDPSEEKYEATLGWKAFGSTDVTITEYIAYSDPKDGEVLKFIPGDKIRMWR